MTSTELSFTDTIASSPDVTSVELDGERVLLHITSGEYFGLNALGARIFELADDEPTLKAVVDAIHAEHQEKVSRKQIEADVRAFVAEMQTYDLLEVTSQKSSSEAA